MTLDKLFILYVLCLLIHKIEIIEIIERFVVRIAVYVKIYLRPQIKVDVESGIASRYLGHCYRFSAINSCVET